MSVATQNSSPSTTIGKSEQDHVALQTFGLALNDSLTKISTVSHNQRAAIVGIAAVLTALPETALVDPQRVGVAVAALLRGRPDAPAVTKQAADFAAGILAAAKEAQLRADEAASKASPDAAPGA